MKGVNIGDIRPMEIPLPPIEEQHEIILQINAGLRVIDNLRQTNQDALQKSSTLTQSILAKAFRGELVPQDPDDEPASVLLERIRAERATAGGKPKRGRRAAG